MGATHGRLVLVEDEWNSRLEDFFMDGSPYVRVIKELSLASEIEWGEGGKHINVYAPNDDECREAEEMVKMVLSHDTWPVRGTLLMLPSNEATVVSRTLGRDVVKFSLTSTRLRTPTVKVYITPYLQREHRWTHLVQRLKRRCFLIAGSDYHEVRQVREKIIEEAATWRRDREGMERLEVEILQSQLGATVRQMRASLPTEHPDPKNLLDHLSRSLKSMYNNMEARELGHIERALNELLAFVKQEKVEKVQTQCCVCDERVKGVVLLPCRHMCACTECAHKLVMCPICRANIDSQLRVYM